MYCCFLSLFERNYHRSLVSMKYNKNSRKSWDVGITIQWKKLNNERKKQSRSSNWVNDEKKKTVYLRNVFFPTAFLCCSTVSHVSRTRDFWVSDRGNEICAGFRGPRDDEQPIVSGRQCESPLDCQVVQGSEGSWHNICKRVCFAARVHFLAPLNVNTIN